MAKAEKLFLAVAIVAILALASVQIVGELAHYPIASPALTNITISATGSASAAPQAAVLYIYANGTGSTTALATANLSQTVSAINSTLYPYVSGNLSNIQTTSYQLGRQYNSSLFKATESISATVPLSQAGAALDSLSTIPNVYLTDVSVQLSGQQSATLRSEALNAAVANATAQAQQIAGPNVRLVVVSVTANGAYYVTPGLYTASASNAQIFGGTSSIVESVTVKYSYSSG